MAAIEDAIEGARWALGIGPGWAGDDTAVPPSQETFDRMATLVQAAYAEPGMDRVPVPTISPLGDGSLDVLWRVGTRMALLNVGASAAYADHDGKGEIRTPGQLARLLQGSLL